jgi:hypothetical protein
MATGSSQADTNEEPRMKRYLALAVVAPLIGTWATVRARLPQSDDDVRLNVVVSDTGNLRSDGKGAYVTGKDHIAAWLNPARWPAMSFDICMNWPFAKYPGLGSDTAPRPSGTAGDRTLLHRMTDPVPGAGGTPRGVFTGPGGSNDVALAKPLTTTVRSFTDLAVGASVSPQSAEVRFCNADCSEYYSVIFGGEERLRVSQDPWCRHHTADRHANVDQDVDHQLRLARGADCGTAVET